jgi:hypothetical protein
MNGGVFAGIRARPGNRQYYLHFTSRVDSILAVAELSDHHRRSRCGVS